MAWSHSWAAPELLTIAGNGRRLMVPRQSCLVCSTTRNPFNNVITRFSKEATCRDVMNPPAPRTYDRELRELEDLMDSLKRSGEPVDKWHTGRRRKLTDQEALPLPYAD